jgi:hypothetical protein
MKKNKMKNDFETNITLLLQNLHIHHLAYQKVSFFYI